MRVIIIDQSETLLAGWWTRKGERYISSWLTISDREKIWFKNRMVERFGENWDKD